MRIWASPTLKALLRGDAGLANELKRKASAYVGHLFDTLNGRTYGAGSWKISARGVQGELKAYVWDDVLGKRAVVRIFAEGGDSISEVLIYAGFIVHPSDDFNSWDAAFLRYFGVRRAVGNQLVEQRIEMKPSLNTELLSGPVNWYGSTTVEGEKQAAIVSWDHGLSTRYRLHPHQDCSGRFLGYDLGIFPYREQSGQPGVYILGKRYDTPFNVVGAAAFKEYIVAVSHVDPYFEDDPGQTTDENKVARWQSNCTKVSVYYGKIIDDEIDWALAGVYDFDRYMKAPWFFNGDGSAAVSVATTSASDQKKLYIHLQYDEDTSVVSCSFASQDLDSVAPYLDTLDDPTEVNEQLGFIGWHPAEPFKLFLDGSITFFAKNDPDQPHADPGHWETYSVPETEGTLADAIAIADELNSYMLGHNNGYRSTGYRVDSRIAATQVQLDEQQADDANSIFDTSNVVFMWANSSNVLGHVRVRGFRDTTHTIGNSRNTKTYTRNVRGKRYIAFDFISSSEIPVYLELRKQNDNPLEFVYAIEETYTIYSQPQSIHSSIGWQERRVFSQANMRGLIEWALYIGDNVEDTFSGGIDGDYQRSYEWSGVPVSSHPDHPVNIDKTYLYSTAPIYSEAGWLKDIDARTGTVSYEKRRVSWIPTEPKDFGDSQSDIFVLTRYLGKQLTQDYIVLRCAGSTVFSEIVAESTGNNSHDLRAQGAHCVTVPRLSFDISSPDHYEALILESLSWYSGFYSVSVGRVFDNTFCLIHPLLLRKAHIQSRRGDVLCSVNDENTARTVTTLGEVLQNRTPTQLIASYIGGEFRKEVTPLVQALTDEEETPTPSTNFQLNPIYAV